MKVFREECAPLKGQGARMKIHRKSWLKQLKVAVSTKASMPSGSSPQNSRTNLSTCVVAFVILKTYEIFSKACIIKMTEKQ
jgi:hypothetical protein